MLPTTSPLSPNALLYTALLLLISLALALRSRIHTLSARKTALRHSKLASQQLQRELYGAASRESVEAEGAYPSPEGTVGDDVVESSSVASSEAETVIDNGGSVGSSEAETVILGRNRSSGRKSRARDSKGRFVSVEE